MDVRVQPGLVLAGYLIEGLIGSGGMGEVYLARHLRLDRRVALKVLPPEKGQDAIFRERFVRESQLAAGIEHPNVIPIYDADEVDGLLYIAMRYVKGGMDLRKLLQREGSLNLRRTLEIVGQIGSALDAAHAQGLVHRDVKPENILIDKSGGTDHCYLADFGVTKRVSAGDPPRTGRGDFPGTISYMAPEQIENREVDERSDVYGLGCVFYECLAGVPPFKRDSDLEVIYAQLEASPPAISGVRPNLPAGLDLVVRIALAKNPDDRYPTCEALVAGARAELASAEVAAPGGDRPTAGQIVDVEEHTTDPRAASIERRRATVLFVALTGLPALADEAEPQHLHEAVESLLTDLAASMEAHGGTTRRGIGDAFMAVFGVPIAHQDDSARAISASLRMLDQVRERSSDLPSPLSIRLGIASGIVLSSSGADAGMRILGEPVMLAARLQQAAAPGEILVSQAVWRAIRDRYEGERLVLHEPGSTEGVDAFRVGSPREAGLIPAVSFTGRAQELALLELLWSAAVGGGTQVVRVVGEPGVGKSRLLSELPARSSAIDLRISCRPDRVFGPILGLLEHILGESPRDLEDLRRLISSVAAMDDEVAVPIGALFGFADAPPAVAMSDEHKKQQVFSGVSRFLEQVTRRTPVFLALDDVDDADESSLDVIRFLLAKLGAGRLMLVLAYRSGFELGQVTSPSASHLFIRLEPLSDEEGSAFACAYLGVKALSTELERTVLEHAGGNPFFLEELLQALAQGDAILIADERAILRSGDHGIPESVQATILARADRLDARSREVLRHAAVVGQRFSTELIEAIMSDPEVLVVLERLRDDQLLTSEGQQEWAFKHALIRDVVYETLVSRERRAMHRKVAEALEEEARDAPSFLQILAGHYRAAGIPEKARQYALSAGDVATQRMGFVEAREMYQAALDMWGQGDEVGRLGLLMKLGWSTLLSGDALGARAALIEAEAGWRALGNTRRAGAALATLGRVYFFTGDRDAALGSLNGAIELLESGPATPELVQAFVWVSTVNILSGPVDEGSVLAARGLLLAEELELPAARAHLMTSLGAFDVLAGDPSGVARLRSGLDLAKDSGDAEAIGRAFVNLAISLWTLAELEPSLSVSREGRETMRNLGALSFQWILAGLEAAALAEMGRYSEAEKLCTEILEEHQSVLTAPGVVLASFPLASVLLRTGRYGQARNALDRALPVARRLGGGLMATSTLLVEAELEAARDNAAAAREAVSEALEAVDRTNALAHFLRALPLAVRLLPREAVVEWRERVRSFEGRHRFFQARLAEAAAILDSEPAGMGDAADLYEGIGLPYDEARSRIDAGQLHRADELIQDFGLNVGPLGDALMLARGGRLSSGPAEAS